MCQKTTRPRLSRPVTIAQNQHIIAVFRSTLLAFTTQRIECAGLGLVPGVPAGLTDPSAQR